MDQKVIPDGTKSEKPGLSRFGRKRLDRSDPHSWADQLEDWFARMTWHIGMVYLLAGIGVVHFVWDVLGYLDKVATGG